MPKELYKNLPCGDEIPGEAMPESDAARTGGDYGMKVSDAALKRGFVSIGGDSMDQPPDWTDRYFAPF